MATRVAVTVTVSRLAPESSASDAVAIRAAPRNTSTPTPRILCPRLTNIDIRLQRSPYPQQARNDPGKATRSEVCRRIFMIFSRSPTKLRTPIPALFERDFRRRLLLLSTHAPGEFAGTA